MQNLAKETWVPPKGSSSWMEGLCDVYTSVCWQDKGWCPSHTEIQHSSCLNCFVHQKMDLECTTHILFPWGIYDGKELQNCAKVKLWRLPL